MPLSRSLTRRVQRILRTAALLGGLASLAPAPAAALRLIPPSAEDPSHCEEATLPFQVRVKTLPNGLTVVAAPFDAPDLVAVYVLVRVGSRDEVEPGRTGFAHFFEHMMFRGTERFSTADFGATLGRHGCDNNAYTTADHTAYHTVGPKSALDDILTLEADRFMHLAYSEADFRTEAGAVLGEYNKAYAAPRMRLYEAMAERSFKVHPYGHTTMGYERDIRALPESLDYAQQFFKRHYTPDNTVVIVAGDIEVDDIYARVEAQFGPWQGKREAVQIPAEPAPEGPVDFRLTAEVPTPTWLNIGWRAPGFDQLEESAALEVAFELLFGRTSPLYRALVLEERQANLMEHWGQDHRRDPHLKSVWLTVAEGADRDAVAARVHAEVAKLLAGDVDAAAVAAARDHLRYASILRLESVNDVAGLLARQMGWGGDPRVTQRRLCALSQVGPGEVLSAARRWLTPQNAVTGSVHSQKEAP